MGDGYGKIIDQGGWSKRKPESQTFKGKQTKRKIKLNKNNYIKRKK
jgi:hypothetical protein